ncbi:hypothetical protein [Colwellia psychrerythraea]|uniref:hypothetical protein n=1 Tax=Colwellia psychrerythraea TaxID=28229 RepID=UPI00059F12BC|nr:hypothetical protein [Colwellia psychrerythraea]
MKYLILNFLLFLIGVAGLMVINVNIFELGDSKFDKGLGTSLGFYFPIWFVFYLPHIITCMLILNLKIVSTRVQAITLLCFTLMILLVVEISFLLNVKLGAIFVEWVVILLCACFARRWLSRTESK